MVKISKATQKQTHDFNKTAWDDVNIQHYGKQVEWTEQKFRFKAEENGKVIGTTTGKFESGILYIETIIVDQEYRKKGIGKMLITKAEEFGRKLGAHKVWLSTGRDWPAIPFYEKMGYHKEADLPNHHFHKDFIVMSKFL